MSNMISDSFPTNCSSGPLYSAIRCPGISARCPYGGKEEALDIAFCLTLKIGVLDSMMSTRYQLVELENNRIRVITVLPRQGRAETLSWLLQHPTTQQELYPDLIHPSQFA